MNSAEQLGNVIGKTIVNWMEESAKGLQCRNLVKYFQDTLYQYDAKYKHVGWKIWRKPASREWFERTRPLVLQGIEEARKKNLATAINIKQEVQSLLD
jgi:hypothetical protein